MSLLTLYSVREIARSLFSLASSETFIGLASLIADTSLNRRSGREIDAEKDAELVQRVKQGDKGAYVSLFKQYGDDVYRYCYYFLSGRKEPEEDAGDAMQEAFVKCLKNIGNLREEGSFFPYLKRTAFTICMDILKDKQASDEFPGVSDSPREIGAIENDPVGAVTIGEKDTPEQKSITREIQNDVRNALNGLPENYRRAVILVHLMEYSYEEAAVMMKARKSDIRNWVHRGVTRLADILMDYRESIA
jgi:RNA polymerase sigma-70 factor (ECF subfamily)